MFNGKKLYIGVSSCLSIATSISTPEDFVPPVKNAPNVHRRCLPVPRVRPSMLPVAEARATSVWVQVKERLSLKQLKLKFVKFKLNSNYSEWNSNWLGLTTWTHNWVFTPKNTSVLPAFSEDHGSRELQEFCAFSLHWLLAHKSWRTVWQNVRKVEQKLRALRVS